MSRKKNKQDTKQIIIKLIILIILTLAIYFIESADYTLGNGTNTVEPKSGAISFNIDDIPEYTDRIYIPINNNIPFFTKEEYVTQSFENYSELDSLGRCGVAYANISKDTMPPEGDKRGDISSVRPTGWRQAKFNGEYIYNRCHLIAYCLSDEDANKLNLITGTRYFNVEGMLTFEKQVAKYIDKNPNNHVLYRVTPMFKGNNLLASGVEMEGYSVEDNGEGIMFNIYVYNVQPGAKINYETGELIK